MDISEIVNAYATFAWNAFQFDMGVFSHWWMYAPALIPACAYACFFFFKWFFITMPIWLPFLMICGAIRNIFAPFYIKNDKIKSDETHIENRP